MKGITRPLFANYYQYILLQFEFPEVTRKWDEKWTDHLARLQKKKTSGRRAGLSYNVVSTLVNAANYGVPQKRERVFIVGFRDDLDVRWSFPRQTHSQEALVVDQWVTGEYWDHSRHATTINAARVSQGPAEHYRRKNDRPNLVTRPWLIRGTHSLAFLTQSAVTEDFSTIIDSSPARGATSATPVVNWISRQRR